VTTPRPRGFALGITITILAAVFLLAAAFSARTNQHLRNASRTAAALQAGYVCEGGVRYGLAQLRRQLQQKKEAQQQDPPAPWEFRPFQTTLSFDTGSVALSVTELTGRQNGYHVHGEAGSGRAGRILDVDTDENGSITQWRESSP